MKEIRISLLLLVSLSMLLLAFLVLFIWGFSYYRQSVKQGTAITSNMLNNSGANAGNVRDSLQEVYNTTIQRLNAELDSTRDNADTIQQQMEIKLQEFYSLKEEIDLLLQKNSSNTDVSIAKQKITELQGKVEDWKNKFAVIAEENKKLALQIQRLSNNSTTTAVPVVIKPVTPQNTIVAEKSTAGKMVAERVTPERTPATMQPTTIQPTAIQPAAKITTAPSFVVNTIQLKAIMQLDDKDQETFQAVQTDLLRGNFEVRNNMSSVKRAEMYVIILQPDGKVMKQSAWETGMFQTNEGRKIYSYKFLFDYNKAEPKRLQFSLESEQYQKGNYQMEIYYDGAMIAKISKRLN